MFGRWSRRAEQPLPRIELPNLDAEVTSHWKPGTAPLTEPSPEAPPTDSLDFASATSHPPRKTRERSRGRRRLVLSLLVGLVGGPIVAAPLLYLLAHVSPAAIRGTASLGDRLTFGPNEQEEIFYSDNASVDEARRLGAFLQREGLFDGLDAKSVRLSKNGETYVVGFAVEWDSWRDEHTVADFRDMLPRLSRQVFEGRPVEIHLCARQPDSKGRPMPTMRVIRSEPAP